MPPDPYRNLAENLQGTVSLISYYARRRDQAPSSLEPARIALQHAIEELHANAAREQAAD